MSKTWRSPDTRGTPASAERLRVVAVVPSLASNTGGTAFAVVDACRAIRDDVGVTVFCTDATVPAAVGRSRRLRADDLPPGGEGLALRVCRSRWPHQFAYSPSLLRELKPAIRHADLVAIHSLNLFPQLAAYIRARSAHVPYIVTPHGALDPWIRRQRRARKLAADITWQNSMLQRASALHFTTQTEANLAADIAPLVPRRIVPNGIEVSAFDSSGDGQRFRNEHLDRHAGPVVMFFGRITEKKGIDILISAFARATRDGTAILAIVGPDDERLGESLAAQASRLGCARRVRFVGPLYGDARHDALRAADIWALTSHTENFGIAVIEAMAAGLPVLISTEVNVASDVARHAAGIVTSLDPDDVAESLSHLLRDEKHRVELANRARQFAAKYDWTAVGPQLAEMYRDVARGPMRHE